ncbi:unnamed protein product, partial [Scytosiphon promiscuus]
MTDTTSDSWPMAGHADSGFESVRRVFEKTFENGEELGAGVAVIKAGKVVVNLVGG